MTRDESHVSVRGLLGLGSTTSKEFLDFEENSMEFEEPHLLSESQRMHEEELHEIRRKLSTKSRLTEEIRTLQSKKRGSAEKFGELHP